jgi:hypothetical protein
VGAFWQSVGRYKFLTFLSLILLFYVISNLYLHRNGQVAWKQTFQNNFRIFVITWIFILFYHTTSSLKLSTTHLLIKIILKCLFSSNLTISMKIQIWNNVKIKVLCSANQQMLHTRYTWPSNIGILNLSI